MLWQLDIQIITARVRSMTGGYVFTGVCLLTLGEIPQSQVLSQVSGPRSRGYLPGTERALATRWAVCLLCYRRRTFLLQQIYTTKKPFY